MDLSLYIRVGAYDLPTPANSVAPSGSGLASEASAVTYNWDTDTLFIVGDEGTSLVQVTKTGVLVDSMTLPSGADAFEDVEGVAYIGEGQFVILEERERTAVLVQYTGNTTLDAESAQTVKLGTTIGNIGLEGVAHDPLGGGLILVKEKDPQGLFETSIDFDLGTASNGSGTTENSINLFDPAVLGLNDLSDVFALSVLPSTVDTDEEDNLLIISQESARIIEINRSDGTIVSTLNLVGDDDNPLAVTDQGHEGITVDRDGNLYVVNEQGGGADTPQLWVYALADFDNAAPTGIMLDNTLSEIAENADTSQRIKVADVSITDDGIGTNNLSVSGADAAFFEVDNTGLYLKAGTLIDFETKATYSVSVNVDDPGLGTDPDASTQYELAVTDIVNEGGLQTVFVTEAAPWSSGDSPVGEDWFELTNTGSTAVDITGWRFDDDSGNFAESDALLGITTIAPGESVIFLNTTDLETVRTAFIDTWFGGEAPADLQFGTYDGAGLGGGGDAIYIFDSAGTVQTSLLFGASPEESPFATFDNSALVDGGTTNTLSQDGVAGGFSVVDSSENTEIGSPGKVGKLFISEAAPWSSGDSPVGEDWFELTNTSTVAIDLTGWRFDDDSADFGESDPLLGIDSIAPGESVIFLNTTDLETVRAAFIDTWFGGNAPSNLRFGTYDGAGLGTGGDAIYLYDAAGNVQTAISFGAATEPSALATFDNAAGLEFAEVETLSSPGFNGGFQITSTEGFTETGSPGTIVTEAIVDNDPPSAVALENTVTELAENTVTLLRIKVADVNVTDDDAGFNSLSLSGADADFFEVNASGLYLKAGTVLDFETKASYQVTVAADDPTVGSTPDATTNFTLNVTDIAVETGPALVITEVAPWSSGESPVGEDWFELTNVSDTAVDISGWSFDDDSVDFSVADALLGITTIAPGESVIFLNTDDLATVQAAFIDTWFDGAAPVGQRFGSYDGAGLGTGGDAVVLFDANGAIKASVTFGASPEASPFATFDNAAGLNHATITALSAVGVNGAFAVSDSAEITEIGSPGKIISNVVPFAGDDFASTQAGVSVRIDILANDSDADGDVLEIVSFTDPARGTLSANSDGSLLYRPDSGFRGTDSFEYQIGDGAGGFDTGTVTVQVEGGGLPLSGFFAMLFSPMKFGGDGSDTLVGIRSDGFLDGRGGDDLLIGSLFSDTLLGGEGDDTLYGSLGNDVLRGGADRDTMDGGFGSDIFVFDDGDTGDTADMADLINGFNDSLRADIIDLSLVDAIAGGKDDAFSFIGAKEFSGAAGELRYDFVGGDTHVTADMNGDMISDFYLVLGGNVSLASDNFIL